MTCPECQHCQIKKNEITIQENKNGYIGIKILLAKHPNNEIGKKTLQLTDTTANTIYVSKSIPTLKKAIQKYEKTKEK